MQFKTETARFRQVSAERDVLLDFVVEIAHAFIRVSHPEIPNPFGALGVIPKIGVPEAPECVVASLVVAYVRLMYPSCFKAG